MIVYQFDGYNSLRIFREIRDGVCTFYFNHPYKGFGDIVTDAVGEIIDLKERFNL